MAQRGPERYTQGDDGLIVEKVGSWAVNDHARSMNVAKTLHAYLAFRAAIRAMKQHNATSCAAIRSLLCPGLCTAIGRMRPEIAAKQMAAAYSVCVLGQAIGPGSHHWLLDAT